jgi:tRNA U34 5-carboxymethylaminomethyl modifying GTPase MnmE/TrmE
MEFIVIFTLGMLAMFNLSLIGVSVVGLVRVMKNNKKLNENLITIENQVKLNHNEYQREISEIVKELYNRIDYDKDDETRTTNQIYTEMNNINKDVYSYVDKRMDKIIEKIDKNK